MRQVVVRLSATIIHVHRIHSHVLHLGTHLVALINLWSMLFVLIEVRNVAAIGCWVRASPFAIHLTLLITTIES